MAGGRRALVAEDEALIAMDVEAALRRAGWEVVGPVSRAADAARLAAREPLDAAVLDIGLGGGTAYGAADLLAARGVPFLFLTGYGPGVLPERLRGRPVLGKPFSAGRLPTALEGAVREQRVRERAYAIWEREGRPYGQAERHWFSAEEELRPLLGAPAAC
jgi:DNA-binding response OmpR family regulator